MTDTRTFKVGDLVTPNPDYAGVPTHMLGRVFRVTKINPKNIVCQPVNPSPGDRGINYPAGALLPSDGTPDPHAPSTQVHAMLSGPLFGNGDIVTMKGGFAKFGWTDTTPLIVLADKASKVNVARLGGSGLAYVRASRSSLVARDLAWLAATLRP